MMSDSKKPTSPTPPLPPPPPVKCPRCDSPNTKFCYYNNYSLSQPRHFCKTCRRYWTKGGALRNVPVGGGCRKPKKSSKTGSTSNTTTNFQTNQNQFAGFNYPMYAGGGNIALSIESLSSMNQDLHWKLQQQRLAMLFGGATATATATSATSMENVHQVAEPITFHQLQVPVMEVGPEGEICGPIKRVHDQSSTATWFLESSTSSSNVIANTAASVGNDQWNGIIPNWGDMQQFSALP